MTTLTAFQAYPAAGKSTAARALADETGAFIIETDAINAELRRRFPAVFPSNLNDWTPDHFAAMHRIAQRRAAGLLRRGVSVIYDATNLYPPAITAMERLAAETGATLEWRYIAPPPLAEWRARLAARPEGEAYWWPVIEKMAAYAPEHAALPTDVREFMDGAA
jgi:predicted kinase